jgi:hypothetical protein
MLTTAQQAALKQRIMQGAEATDLRELLTVLRWPSGPSVMDEAAVGKTHGWVLTYLARLYGARLIVDLHAKLHQLYTPYRGGEDEAGTVED